MDSYDYNGVTHMPFTPYTGSSGYQQQQQQSGGYYPYNDRSNFYGYGSVQDSMGSFVREPFTADFLWGMTFGTTVLMLVLCLALWCCLPVGLGSAAACYVRKYRKRPEKHVNGIVTIA